MAVLMKMGTMTTLNRCLLLLLFVQYTNGQDKSAREPINENEYKKTISSSQVSLIHFYVSNANNEYVDFLNTFYEASEYLTDFRIKLAVVDCNNDYIEEYCTEKQEVLMAKVFVFRNGKSLTELATDTLFDINSIVSSALHLSLLQEVPIVQNQQELSSVLHSSRAKQDVIFGKVLAIGTAEHRAFMEAAFAYGHRYKFLVTTSTKNVLKDHDAEMWDETKDGVWLFQCHQTLLHEECPRIRYRGALRVTVFPSFMKALDIPLISKIEDGGKSLHKELKMPTLMLLTKCKKFPEVEDVLGRVSTQYLGSVGFIIIDLNYVDPQRLPSLRLDSVTRQNTIPYIVMDAGRSDNAELYQMNEDITDENLKMFIENVLEETVTDDYDDEDDDYEETDENIEEIQDDPVQDATFQERVLHLDAPNVQVLTDRSYPDFIAMKALTAVFFYVKWDPRCLAFREPYALAAKEIIDMKGLNKTVLGQVNCFDWPDVCSKANVTRYPTIRMYKRSNEVVEYRGVLDDFYFLKFYLMYTVSSPIILMKEQEGRDFMEAEVPSWGSKYLEAFTLGIFPEGTSEERMVFNEVAKELRGQCVMGSCVKECAEALGGEIGGLEATVVTIKWEDVHQPELIYNEPFTVENLQKFVLASSEKVMPELTAVNLPFFLKRKSVLMMLFHGFDRYSESAEQSLADIARENRFPNVQICWLDASSSDTIGTHLLKEYDIEFVRFRPTIALLDFKSQNLYHYGESVDYRKTAFTSWMKKALSGEIDSTATLQEKEWKPLIPGYDFLSMMKEEAETEKEFNANNRPGGRLANKRESPEKDNSEPSETSSEEESLPTEEDKDNMLGDLPVNEAHRHVEL